MLKRFVPVFVLVLLSVPAFAEGTVTFGNNLDITDPKMVADLAELDAIISSISIEVMACIDSGKEHKPCMCENRELFAEFSEVVNKFFKKYPQLDGQDLVNFKNNEGALANLSLETAKRQAEMKLSCEE